MNVQLIDNQVTLVRDGKPLVEDPSVDVSDLIGAEQAVAFFGAVGMRTAELEDLTMGSSEETIVSIRARLEKLRREWRNLPDGAAITIDYCGRTG